MREHPNDSALLPNDTVYVGPLDGQGQPLGFGASFHAGGSAAVTLLRDADASKCGRWIGGKLHVELSKCMRMVIVTMDRSRTVSVMGWVPSAGLTALST